MDNNEYKLAGWLALLFLPIYFVVTHLGMLVVAFTFFSLRKLLSEKYKSKMGGNSLLILAFSYVLFVVFSFAFGIMDSYELSIIGSVGISLFIGVNLILLIPKIIKTENDFNGLKKLIIGSLAMAGFCFGLSAAGISIIAIYGNVLNPIVMQVIGLGLVVFNALLCAAIGMVLIKTTTTEIEVA